MDSREIIESYFQWLTDMVCTKQEKRDYDKLLRLLFGITFRFTMDRDANRAADGVDMRSKFTDDNDIDFETRHNAITGPCSVLEMLVGLADRAAFSMIDEDLIDDDNPTHWIFWIMMSNLGLVRLKNADFSHSRAVKHIDTFMDRKYADNGARGGLFVVKDATEDLRDIEIWYQMCWFINSISEN